MFLEFNLGNAESLFGWQAWMFTAGYGADAPLLEVLSQREHNVNDLGLWLRNSSRSLQTAATISITQKSEKCRVYKFEEQ